MGLSMILLRKLNQLDFYKLEIWRDSVAMARIKSSKLSANPSFDAGNQLDWLRYNDFDVKLVTSDDRLVYFESVRELQFLGSELEEIRFEKPTVLFLFPDGYYSSGFHNAEHGKFLVPSISALTLSRLVDLNSNLVLKGKELELEKQRIESSLQENHRHLLKLSKQRTTANKTLQAETIISKKARDIQDLKLRVLGKRRDVEKRKAKIELLLEQTRQNYSELHPAVASLTVTKLQMKSLHSNLIIRQKELIFDLLGIYPIKNDCIRGIYLPNSIFAKLDKELIAVALGHTSHCISIIAEYLYLPLRYPIQSRSSRSVIYDFISTTFDGPKQFPLYLKGSDKMRFEYGVFLLNKDIEQIMNAIGISVKNLRQTLSNIQLIYSRLERICTSYSDPNSTPLVNWNLLNIPNTNSDITGSEMTTSIKQ